MRERGATNLIARKLTNLLSEALKQRFQCKQVKDDVFKHLVK